jgi:hypothetical protein
VKWTTRWKGHQRASLQRRRCNFISLSLPKLAPQPREQGTLPATLRQEQRLASTASVLQ